METPRRNFLKWGGAFLGALLGSQLLGKSEVEADVEVQAGSQPVAYPPLAISRRVSQVPIDPGAAEWKLATPVNIPLGPQIMVKPRLLEPSVTEVLVRSLFDQERIGFLLEWKEKRENRDTSIGRTDQFRDAAALSFPANADKPIPYFGMGHVGNEVVIYQWKSDWEFAPEYDVEQQYQGMHVDFYPLAGTSPGQIPSGGDYGKEGEEWPARKAYNTAWAAGSPLANPELKKKTSVEKLIASGFGNLTSDSIQDGQGKAKWDGEWHVVITLPTKQDRYKFIVGQTYPINFAVWDGHNKERGAEKSVSTWSSFVLERQVGFPSFAFAALAAGAVALVEWLVLRRRKIKREGQELNK